MTKKLLNNISEYRQWAWSILLENDNDRVVSKSLGLRPAYDCFDYNDNDEPIDENGNVLPEDTAETIHIEDFIAKLIFPVIAVYWIANEWDRGGDVKIVAVEFVELREFGIDSTSNQS